MIREVEVIKVTTEEIKEINSLKGWIVSSIKQSRSIQWNMSIGCSDIYATNNVARGISSVEV